MRRQMEGSTLGSCSSPDLRRHVAGIQPLDLHFSTSQMGGIPSRQPGARHNRLGTGRSVFCAPWSPRWALASSRPNLPRRTASDCCWASSTISVCARLIRPGVSCHGPKCRRSRSVSMDTIRQRRAARNQGGQCRGGKQEDGRTAVVWGPGRRCGRDRRVPQQGSAFGAQVQNIPLAWHRQRLGGAALLQAAADFRAQQESGLACDRSAHSLQTAAAPLVHRCCLRQRPRTPLPYSGRPMPANGCRRSGDAAPGARRNAGRSTAAACCQTCAIAGESGRRSRSAIHCS